MSTNSSQKTTLLICGIFIIALASGVMLGNGLARKNVEATVPPVNERDPSKRLAMDLNLTPQQVEQQKSIFEKARDKGRGQDDRIATMDKQRSDAIAELLSPEQKLKYDAIQDAHKKAWEQMGKDRRDAFNEAQKEFKGILNSEQLNKYEEILRAQPQRGPRRGPATSTAPSTSTAPATNTSVSAK